MASAPVGVVGLGLLGSALAERLLNAGHDVRVWNRTRSKADPLLARGARWSDNPPAECPRTLISLYTTETVSQVLERMDAGLASGRILIDTTTGDPAQTEALGRRLAERGVQYLEAPVSGSSEQARRGELTVIAAGPREAFEACRDLFAQLAQRAFYVGPWGAAARMKLISNLVLGLNRAALAEGLGLAQAAGLDLQTALEVLAGSAAYSKAMDVKGRKMVEGDFAPQARLSQHLKDVRLILQEGARWGAKLPLSAVHCRLLEELERAGCGELDNSAIFKAFSPPASGGPSAKAPPAREPPEP